jgi:hypothetical protein
MASAERQQKRAVNVPLRQFAVASTALSTMTRQSRSAPRIIGSLCSGASPRTHRPLYVMRVSALRKTKFLYQGTIWIDSLDFAVTRIEAEPAKNPSFWTLRSRIHHQYQKIGAFYLPTLNQTVTDVRLGGKAVLTIRYLDYKLPQQSASGTGPISQARTTTNQVTFNSP